MLSDCFILPNSFSIFNSSFLLDSELEYLLKNGCERVISNARDRAFEMRSLEHYKCLDERGKDQGINGIFF